jgi:hypothetical protein
MAAYLSCPLFVGAQALFTDADTGAGGGAVEALASGGVTAARAEMSSAKIGIIAQRRTPPMMTPASPHYPAKMFRKNKLALNLAAGGESMQES